MKKQIRNILTMFAAFFLMAFFCFLPNIQAWITDWKTFDKSEKIALNPVEISVEATQTTLEKIKIVNNHILSVAVTPSARTVDGNDVEQTTRKQVNKLFQKMKISYRVDKKWNCTYKKLYTFITKQGTKISPDAQGGEPISNIKNLLVWYVVLTPDSEEDEDYRSIALIMDAYTDQILAIDLYVSDYVKDWKNLADHIDDIPKGFLSYLNIDPSEKDFKKKLLENNKMLEQYKNAKKEGRYYSGISGSTGIYAIQNEKREYIPIEWNGYGFMINNVYN